MSKITVLPTMLLLMTLPLSSNAAEGVLEGLGWEECSDKNVADVLPKCFIQENIYKDNKTTPEFNNALLGRDKTILQRRRDVLLDAVDNSDKILSKIHTDKVFDLDSKNLSKKDRELAINTRNTLTTLYSRNVNCEVTMYQQVDFSEITDYRKAVYYYINEELNHNMSDRFTKDRMKISNAIANTVALIEFHHGDNSKGVAKRLKEYTDKYYQLLNKGFNISEATLLLDEDNPSKYKIGDMADNPESLCRLISLHANQHLLY